MEWSRENTAHLNPRNCKELRISFVKQDAVFDPVVVNGKELEVVNCVKLLGLTISNNLTWNVCIDEVVKKIGERLYFLVQLRRLKYHRQIMEYQRFTILFRNN